MPSPLPRLAAFVAALTLPAPAVAQDADADGIDEIQVTATRRPVDAGKVSAALTVVTAVEIRAAKLTTDVLAARPGVFLQQTTPGQGAAIVRGLKGSEVLHLVDGFRLNNAIFRNAPTQYLAMVAPASVERIEVVRGAPTSLYGSDAVGGVVQVVSRMPDPSASGLRGDAFASYETAELARLVRASVESGSGRVGALVAAHYGETGNRRTGSGERVAPTGYSSRGARVALTYEPGEFENWLFDLQFSEQPRTPRIDELVPGFGETEPAASEFFFAPNQRAFAHARYARTEGPLDADWTVDLGWQRIVDDRVSRNFGSDIRRYEDNRSDLYGLTVSASRDNDAGSWIVGAELYHDRVASTRFEESLVNGSLQQVTPRFPDGATVDQAALFVNGMQAFAERHSLSGGVRYSSVRVELPAAGTIAASSTRQQDFSADLGWLTDLDDHTQLTANAGFGFRAPNVFDLGTLGERPGNRFNIPNPDLDSERVVHLDAGIRRDGERLRLDLVIFALRYRDRIASVLTGATTPDGRDVTQSRNVARASIRGVELAAEAELASNLHASVVLNHLRGTQSEADGSDAPADRIPPFNGRIGLRYDWSESLTFAPYLHFSAAQERLSPRDVRDVRIDPNGTPGWATLNLATSWQASDSWTIDFAVENLLDKRYRVHGSGIDAAGRNVIVSAYTRW